MTTDPGAGTCAKCHRSAAGRHECDPCPGCVRCEPDPGAVTHDEARAVLHEWAGARTAAKLLRYIDQQESALTAMTTRAEAAEAEMVMAHRMCDAALLLLEARVHLANEPDNLQWREIQRQAEAVLGGRRHMVSLPHGIDLATYLTAEAERKDGAGDPPPEPAWYVVEEDGSYNQVATEREAQQLLKCATECAYITREKPPEPAPAVVAKSATTDEPAPAGFAVGQQVWPSMTAPRHCYTGADGGEVVRVDSEQLGTMPYVVRWRNGSTCNYAQHELTSVPPAPQPAAAPKVLPVDQLRLDLVVLAERTDDDPWRAACLDLLTDIVGRLEQGGEGTKP